MYRYIICVLLFFTLSETAISTAEESKLRKVLDESLEWYNVFPTTDMQNPMKVHVALRWANVSRGSANGLTLLWLDRGCPRAVAAIYPWQGNLHCEFDSMSTVPVVAVDKDSADVVWQPNRGGIKLQPVPNGGKPAPTAATRMLQMKKIVRSFESTLLGWKADRSDRQKLRRLPTPLYRYKSENPDVLDGCVFAFVQGTDPESLLILEAAAPHSDSEWQYAFVRRSSAALQGSYQGKIVWTVNWHSNGSDPKRPHYTVRRNEKI